MIPPDQATERDPQLRAAAETLLAHMRPSQISARPSAESAQDLLHELQVHQIELEMQNEALRQAKSALGESRDRYVDLYEFAPVGYLTLTADAFIASINLTGSVFLGRERNNLLLRHFNALVVAADQERWSRHFQQVKEHGGLGKVELSLLRGDGTVFDAQIDSAGPRDGTSFRTGAPEVRMVLTDIGQRKKAEAELLASEAHLRRFTAYLQQVREEERAHFSRELHDDLGQNMTALRIDFNVLAAALGAQNPAIVARLAAIDWIINGTVDAVRRLCEDLRPGALDDLGLEAVLSAYVKRFARQSGVACDLALGREDFGLDEATSTAIFRIVQESLTNIARHARASHAMLALQEVGDDWLLTVADDGCGQASERSGERRGFGLLGMRERVNLLGGRLVIDSEPGRGTHIEVSIPRKQPVPL